MCIRDSPAPSGAVKSSIGGFSPLSDGDTARETVGPVSHRDPEAWCSERGHYRPERPNPGVPGRGHYRPRFPARLPTGWRRRRLILLSNASQILWSCSGSLVLFFAVVAFVVYRRRRVIFLRGAVYDGRIGQALDHRAAEFIMSSPDPSAHERGGRGVRKL